MKSILRELLPSIRATVVLAAVTCGLYPLVVTGLSGVLFPKQAHGTLIEGKDGTIRGSALLSQNFTSEKYFHPRPSAAGSGHDGASSSGSNLGPTSQKLSDAIQERVAAYRAANGLASDAPVPADAVTASGSGLDPHISLKNAELQAARVAKARGLNPDQIKQLMVAHTQNSGFPLLGRPGVNVATLNLALDGN